MGLDKIKLTFLRSVEKITEQTHKKYYTLLASKARTVTTKDRVLLHS
jgi:hypothetical protein